MKALRLAALTLPLLLGAGTAHSLELEDRVTACAQVLEHFEEAWQLRFEEAPIEVTYAVLVGDPRLHPLQRWVVWNTVESIYTEDPKNLPNYKDYRTVAFASCLVTLGSGAIELVDEDKPTTKRQGL